jgi:hypothetical protein
MTGLQKPMNVQTQVSIQKGQALNTLLCDCGPPNDKQDRISPKAKPNDKQDRISPKAKPKAKETQDKGPLPLYEAPLHHSR